MSPRMSAGARSGHTWGFGIYSEYNRKSLKDFKQVYDIIWFQLFKVAVVILCRICCRQAWKERGRIVVFGSSLD